MRLAVLGPNGQLGSDFVRAARSALPAAELILIGRDKLELSDPARLAEVLGSLRVDIIANFTGYHKTDEVESNATLAFRINAHAVREMARVCARKSARFIHISSDFVFGGDCGRRTPYREIDPPNPLNVYGASKAMGEAFALRENAGTTVLRVASLFGTAGASGKGGNFVETMLRLARERREVRVVDDQIMSPTATSDAALAICRLIAAEAPAGIYHVVNSGAVSWHGFAAEIYRLARVETNLIPISTAEFPTLAERPAFSALDNRKAGRILGNLAPWSDALERYLRSKGHLSSQGKAFA